MALKDTFNNDSSDYSFDMLGDTLLSVSVDDFVFKYDFALRLMTAQSGEGLAVTPFSLLDRDTLVEMRDRLVELGGAPPELPAERQTGPVAPRKLNP